MATVDMTRGTAGQDLDGTGVHYILSRRVDFSETPAAASDHVKALDIAAGTMVLKVWTVLITKEGATLTATVGDSASATVWDTTGASLNGTPDGLLLHISTEGTDTNGMGKLYAADDYIYLHLSANAAATAVIDVYAECINLTQLPKTDLG